MNFQRHAIGVIAVAFLVVAGYLYFLGTPKQLVPSGICSRVGFLLFSIWLAFPQLETLKSKMSMVVLSLIIILLLVTAIRPQLFAIAFAVAVGGFFLNGIIRRFSKAKK